MRARILQVMLLLVVLGATFVPATSAMASVRHHVVFAQDSGTDSEQGESGDGSGEGQKDPEAETDPGAGEDAPAEEEEGPPWTYQMARLSIGLVVLLCVGMALLYRKLIGSRQKARS